MCIDYPGKDWDAANVEPGDPVRVRVQVPVSFVKFFGWGVTIKGSATMRIERIADTHRPGSAAREPPREHQDLLVSRLRREERGGILVLSAILIPVFIVMTAMVVDVGQWYTHKRQLQTRADAGAFAAGIEYGDNWKACVYDGTDANLLAAKAAAARAIANRARQYAADPEATDYAPDPLPATLYNQNIANQSKLDVVVNSRRTPTTPTTPTAAGRHRRATPASTTRATHLARRRPMGRRPGEGERPAVDLRLDRRPAQAEHRARAGRDPAGDQRQQVPAARGAEQRDHEGAGALLQRMHQPAHADPELDLRPQAAPGGRTGALSSARAAARCGASRAPRRRARATPSRSFPLTLPTYGGCGQPYLPVGMEVRLASTDSVDLNQSCAALIAAKFADCFHRLSQIRVWNDGMAPRVRDVQLTGGCGVGDAYFGPLPVAANPRMPLRRERRRVLGHMDDDELAVSSNFHVTVNGVDAPPPGPTTPSGVWTVPSHLTANPGANDVTVQISWTDTTTAPVPHIWEQGGGACRNGSQNPCQYNGARRPSTGRTSARTPPPARSRSRGRTLGRHRRRRCWGRPYDTVADGGNTREHPPDRRDQERPQDRRPHDDPAGRPAGEPVSPLRPELRAGPGVLGLPVRLPAVVRQELVHGRALVEHDDEAMSERRSILLVQHDARPLWPELEAERVAVRADGAGLLRGAGRRQHRRRDQELRQHQQQLVSGADAVQLRRQLRRQARNPDRLAAGKQPCRRARRTRASSTSSSSRTSRSRARPEATRRRPCPILTFASFYVFNWTAQNNQQSDPCPDRDFDHDKNSNTPQIPVPEPAERRHHWRLRQDGRLRVRPGRRDRGLRRGPAGPVPCFTRPMSLPI